MVRALFIVAALLLVGCSTGKLDGKDISPDSRVVFGRFTVLADGNPQKLEKDYFTYQVDSRSRAFARAEFPKPNFDKDTDFFWVEIPRSFKVFKVKSYSVTATGKRPFILKEPKCGEFIAHSDLPPTGSPIYVGHFIIEAGLEDIKEDRPEFVRKLYPLEKHTVLKSVRVEEDLDHAHEYLVGKNLTPASVVSSKLIFESESCEKK